MQRPVGMENYKHSTTDINSIQQRPDLGKPPNRCKKTSAVLIPSVYGFEQRAALVSSLEAELESQLRRNTEGLGPVAPKAIFLAQMSSQVCGVDNREVGEGFKTIPECRWSGLGYRF